MAQAAPVTFRFEAEITEIEGDVAALNLPFSLSAGQVFLGQYSFNNPEGLLDIVQGIQSGNQGNVALNFEGTILEAVTNFGTLNDGGPIDINNPPPPGPKSSISLGYFPPTDVIPGWGGGLGLHPAGVSLALVGADGIITQPEDVLDVQTWNQLTTLRRLTMQIGYPVTVTIQVNIGSFVSVPEPTDLHLFLGSFLGWLALFRK